MKASNILVALSFVGLTGVAMAKGSKEPNCDVNGKKTHVKDEKACTKKKGTWMGTAAAPAGGAAAPAAAPAGGADTSAPAAAPAGGAPAGGAEGGATK